MDSAFAALRNSLGDLIGFTGKYHLHPVLGSTGAYQVAYWKLYAAVAGLLPGHGGCAVEALEKHHAETVGETGAVQPAAMVPARA